MISRFVAICFFACGLLLFSQCNASKSAKGGIIGGAAGGTIGSVIGKKSGSTAAGIIVGAAIGGAAGVVIGKYMDKQAQEIDKEVDGATVVRYEEGILVTFDSGLMFDFDSDKLKPATRTNLRNMANVMDKYDQTKIVIEGHTDSKGAAEYNQGLSVRRAASVSSYLQQQGISASRIRTVGYGEKQPVADNDTEAGRAENRRVEVVIVADESLKHESKN